MQSFEKTEDLLRVQGVNARGFGTIPKLVMKDPRLTVQSKAIYAYFRSYAGAGNTAFPSVGLMMADLGFKDAHTFRKHRDLLEDYGYLKIEQMFGKGCKFGRNIYTLIDHPEPKVKKQHTDTGIMSNAGEKTRHGNFHPLIVTLLLKIWCLD